MEGSSRWDSVLAMAEEQWGLVTRRQVEAAGVAWSTLSRKARTGVLERVARGVYRVRGSAPAEHLQLRAAWLQLAPGIPAWDRMVDQGVASHRSAAAFYGLGHLPADVHEFTLATRRQTRRVDVRLHKAPLPGKDWVTLAGVPVTRPGRIAVDLLHAGEDPGAVGEMIADALRGGYDDPGTIARALAPHAATRGLSDGDGVGLLRLLLEAAGDPGRQGWLDEAAGVTSGSAGAA